MPLRILTFFKLEGIDNVRSITSDSIREVTDLIHSANQNGGSPDDLWKLIFADENAQDIVLKLISITVFRLCPDHEECRLKQLMTLATLCLAIGFFSKDAENV